MTDADATTSEQQRQRHEQIRALVHDCIVRRAAGEAISDQQLIEAHPEMMPELEHKLRALRVIESAQRRSDEEIASTQKSLHLRCPECHSPMALQDDTPVSDIVCASCGSRFGLADEESEIHIGMRVSHFEILSKLGVGAQGSVWCARDTQLDRLVAVKVPRKSRLTQDEAEQLVREARAVAQLTHPNIVHIHEVGREGDLVYLVTDLVEGENLADWIAENRLTPREAAALCATLAEALQHAHEQGVIHRDLKPSNLMLDENGEPYLTDFGLAKREATDMGMTVDGKLLGTPAYMSPEQARGTPRHADCRSDIFSLGVLFFELLTGERPFRGTTRMLVHQILVEDAPSPRKLSSRIPHDLATICLKCLEKEPRQRYQTAMEVREDLHRFLCGEPVQARPISSAARAWRWCKRNPMVAGLVATLTAVLIISFVGVASQWLEARNQRIKAEAETDRANARFESHRRLLYVSDIAKIAEAWEAGSGGVARELLMRHVPGPGQPDLRGFEWYHLWKRCQTRGLAEVLKPDRDTQFALFTMALSPQGQLLAAAGGPGTVFVWDLRTGKIRQTLRGHQRPVLELSFSPRGRFLASAGWENTTYLWSLETGKKVAELPRGEDGVRFSHNGELLAVCDLEGVSVWDISDVNNLRERKSFPVPARAWSVDFSPDDGALAAAGGDGLIRLWNLVTEAPIGSPLVGHSDVVCDVRFSPDGRSLVSGSHDRTVRLWDVATRTERQKLAGHSGYVESAVFSPDGQTVASASHDGTARLWDAESGKLRDTIRGHEFQVWAVAFDLDGQNLFTGSGDGTIRRWTLSDRRQPQTLEGDAGEDGAPIAFDPTGRCLAAVRPEFDVIVWDITSSNEVATFGPHSESIRDLAFSPDGQTFASATRHRVKVWDRDTRRVIYELDGSKLVAFSPDGTLLATGGPFRSPTIRLWDTADGTLLRTLPGIENHLWSLAFSSDQKNLAAGGLALTGPELVVWDVQTGQQVAASDAHLGSVNSIAYCPTAPIACTGGFDGEIKLWNSRTWTELDREIEGRHVSMVTSVAFSPDGRSVASGSEDATIRIWHVATGRHLLTLRDHQASVKSVAFSPDGRFLASSSQDGTIRLWPAATDDEVGTSGMAATPPQR